MASRRERRERRKKKKAPKSEVVEEVVKEPVKEKQGNFLYRIYEEKYKQLLIIPFAMLLIAFIIIGMNIAQTGDFINKDVTLKGGLTVTILTSETITTDSLHASLSSEFPDGDIRVRALSEFGSQAGLIIDASDVDQDSLVESLEKKIPNFRDSYSIESIGPELGSSFFKQTMIAIIIAFLLMALVVFYYFRTLVPSLAVVLAAFSDIVVTVAVLDVLNIRLSTAGIAGLLMLIGYSVDTDILLSTRVLKGTEGSKMDRIMSAVKTGLTMNATTLAAITVALFVSQSETISQIMTILLIGLIVDIINTWIQNTGILRLYLENEKN